MFSWELFCYVQIIMSKIPSLAENFDVRIGSPSKSLFINLSITKKFPTKRIFKTVDSSVRNPGEVDYDTQNWPQHQKTEA